MEVEGGVSEWVGCVALEETYSVCFGRVSSMNYVFSSSPAHVASRLNM